MGLTEVQMTETVAPVSAKKELPVADEAQEELVYEFENYKDQFYENFEKLKNLKIFNDGSLVCTSKEKLVRFPFNRHPKAQPGILPSKEDNGCQRFYAQFCRLTVARFPTGRHIVCRNSSSNHFPVCLQRKIQRFSNVDKERRCSGGIS